MNELGKSLHLFRTEVTRVCIYHERVVWCRKKLGNWEDSSKSKGKITRGNRPSEAGAEENRRRDDETPTPTFGSPLGKERKWITAVILLDLCPWSPAHVPNGFVPTHVNPYCQPSTGIVNGQTSNFPFQAQTDNLSVGGTSVYPPQGGSYGVTCKDEAKRRNSGTKTKIFEEKCYLLLYDVSSKEDTVY
ncbi:hypothetical protein Tco_0957956 [Tanacetum coccineum]